MMGRLVGGSVRTMFVAVVAASVAVAAWGQPPERPDGPPDRASPEGFRGSPDGRGGAPGGGPGMREGRGGPPGGPMGGPPSPERFVEHALSFDADGDGKLDRDELRTFAEEIQRMRGGPGMRGGRGGEGGRPSGGPPGRGPGGRPGFDAPGGRGTGDGPTSEGGPRPERPRRPE